MTSQDIGFRTVSQGMLRFLPLTQNRKTMKNRRSAFGVILPPVSCELKRNCLFAREFFL